MIAYEQSRTEILTMTKEQQERFEEIQNIINQLVYDLEELKNNLGDNKNESNRDN